MLLLVALGSITLAASASFDRVGPPLGIGLGVLLLGYLFDVLGTLWPDAEFLQPLSPFNYLQPLEILSGRGDERDVLVLAGIVVGNRLRAVALSAQGPRGADLSAVGSRRAMTHARSRTADRPRPANLAAARSLLRGLARDAWSRL